MQNQEALNKVSVILKDLRKLGNLTQEDFSHILETDRSNIANYERGKRLPPVDSLIKIANYFNVSLDYLILGKTRSEDQPQDGAYNELMAENTALMESELKFRETLKQKDEEIRILKQYIESLKEYNNYLEKK